MILRTLGGRVADVGSNLRKPQRVALSICLVAILLVSSLPALTLLSAPAQATVSTHLTTPTMSPSRPLDGNFSLTTPTISPSHPMVDLGQHALLNLTVSWAGGVAPYFVTLYSSSTSFCSSGSTQVELTLGTGGHFVIFPVPSPSGSTYYCATVRDSSGSPKTMLSGVALFSVNPALSATISPAAPIYIDSTQSTTLTVLPSHGTPSYSYQWYEGVCNASVAVIGAEIVGATSASFFTGMRLVTTDYAVLVTDSSVANPPGIFCAHVTVTVEPTLAPMIFLTPTVMDAGQFNTVSATVQWPSEGTSPYTVVLYSGSSTTCASDTTVVAKTTVTGYSASLSFAAPKSNTRYCATVTDSSDPVTVPTSTALLTVNPALGTAVLAIYPKVFDFNHRPAGINASVTWSGGTSPYTVTLYSGSSTTCASDTVQVEPALTGITGSSAGLDFPSPGSSTYYCAQVTDSATPPFSVSTSTVLVTVNPSLANVHLAITFSSTVTATVTWSGGTSPYTVILFSGTSPSCHFNSTVAAVLSISNPLTGVTKMTGTFTLATPSTSVYFCAGVRDSTSAPPVLSSAVHFTVLTAPVISLALSLINKGQGTTISTATSFSGGSPKYTCQWLEEAPGESIFSDMGASFTSGCTTSSTPSVATGALSTVGIWSFELQVTDSSSPPETVTSNNVSLSVGYGPEGVATNPNSGMVYVVDPNLGPGLGHISIIDSLSNTVAGTIMVGTQPWGIAVNPGTNCLSGTCWGTIYVTNYGSNAVSVINGTNNALIAFIPVGMQPEGIAVNPSLGVAYVADSGSNAITVINMTTNTVIVSGFTVGGSSPESVAVGPNNAVFVTDYGSNTISVTAVNTYGIPYGFANVVVGSNPWGIAIDQSTNRVYVTNSGSATVSVLNGSTYATIATVKVGSTPEGISVGPSNTVYVANAGSGTVSVINTLTNAVKTSTSPPIPIPVESSPWGVAYLSPASFMYVTNSASNTVSVINLLTNEVITTIIVS